MDLQDIFDRFNFFINKYTGSWYTIPELESIADNAQMSLYEDLQPQYATSERVKDALSPFRGTYPFAPINTISGYVVIPSNSNFLNLLSVTIEIDISSRIIYKGLTMYNEDEIADRLNSQISPVVESGPIGEVVAPRYIRLYPTAGYRGNVKYLRRPVKPVFAYTTISQRIIVYNQAASTQLEWSDNWINPLIIKGLLSIGINLTDAEISQFAELKSKSNFQSVNML